MSKKGEFGGVGLLIMVAVAVIVAVTLLTGGISGGVGTLTKTTTMANVTYAAPAAGASINLPGQAWRDVSVINASTGTVVPASNYTITNYVVSNGQLVTTLTAKEGTTVGWQSRNINVSGVMEPFGYDTNAGGRAMASLIIIFAALAIGIVALAPIIKDMEIFS